MVHALKFLKTVSEKEKELEESLIEKVESVARKDQKKQHVNIQKKLAKGEKLTEFEKWFKKQPEYQQFEVVE